MGNASTGKSCIIKRFCEERFVSKYIPTIGVDYGVKPCPVNGIDTRVNFWDLSGHSEFFEVRNEFYKDAQGILLVYDVTSRETYDVLDNWLAEAAKYGCNPREIPIALCANKSEKKDRKVSEDEGREFAKSRNLSYFETSAASGSNVNEMFDFLFQAVLRRLNV
jgi:DnaJ family protein C protein 27